MFYGDQTEVKCPVGVDKTLTSPNENTVPHAARGSTISAGCVAGADLPTMHVDHHLLPSSGEETSVPRSTSLDPEVALSRFCRCAAIHGDSLLDRRIETLLWVELSVYSLVVSVVMMTCFCNSA